MDGNFLSNLTTYVVQQYLIYTEQIQFSNPTKLGLMTVILLSLFWFLGMKAKETRNPWGRLGLALLAGVFLVNGGSFLIAAFAHWS